LSRGSGMSGKAHGVEFESRGDGQFALRGELSFQTAIAALDASKGLFSPHRELDIDLAGVGRVDSAGLALLLEWVSWARSQSRTVRFRNIPQQILSMAQMSEVESMLPGASG
jgi:phospholipid transport system transporter-binding protein